MARGNQRELARAKANKKAQEQSKKRNSSNQEGNKGMKLEQRKQRDAEVMRLKQQKSLNDKE